jgi:hypothetical protein
MVDAFEFVSKYWETQAWKDLSEGILAYRKAKGTPLVHEVLSRYPWLPDWETYYKLKTQGTSSRAEILKLAELERTYPGFNELFKPSTGKGRSRRRKLTRRRRTTRKRV